MHSFTSDNGSGYQVLHNGDFSGDVKIITTSEPRKEDWVGTPTQWIIELPFDLLAEIVAEKIRSERIAKLEDMGPDELLGIEQ